MSGLQPLVEPCLRQALKLLPRPELWSALGPVPTACLLFLDAYYQAWSRQVSVALLPCPMPRRPCFHLNTPPSLCFHLSTPASPLPFSYSLPFPSYLLSTFPLHTQWSFQRAREPQAAAQPPRSLYAVSGPLDLKCQRNLRVFSPSTRVRRQEPPNTDSFGLLELCAWVHRV